MKDLVKTLSVITGIFRSVVTILCLLGILFVALVDVNLLLAFLDIIGFTSISAAVIKPILIGALALLFIVNFIISRHIFKAGDNGNYHLSNFFFSLIFLSITAFIFITFRNLTTRIIYVFLIFNSLIAINSILGLIGRARGIYLTEADLAQASPAVKTDYIAFNNIEASPSLTSPTLKTDENIPEVKVTEEKSDKTDKKIIKETIITKDNKEVRVENNKANNNQTAQKEKAEPKEKQTTTKLEKVEVKEEKPAKDDKKDQVTEVIVKESSKEQSQDKEDIQKTPKTSKEVKPVVKEEVTKTTEQKPDQAPKTIKRVAKKKVEPIKDPKADKKSTNTISYQSQASRDMETYGDEDIKQVKKNKESEVYKREDIIGNTPNNEEKKDK